MIRRSPAFFMLLKIFLLWGLCTFVSVYSVYYIYVVSARKLCKIRNVSFGDIFIFLNSLMPQASLHLQKVKISSQIIHFVKFDSFLAETK